MNLVYDFLKQSNTYYLATIDGNQPRVRPFGTINLFNGKLYIMTQRDKDVAKQMVANSRVEISAVLGEKWIRIEATMVDDNSVEAKQSMLDAYPFLQSMYSATDNGTMVLYMTDVKASICSHTDKPHIVEF